MLLIGCQDSVVERALEISRKGSESAKREKRASKREVQSDFAFEK